MILVLRILFIFSFLGAVVESEVKSVLTFNAGLYESIGLGILPNPPSRVERLQAIIGGLFNVDNDADFACLQEVHMGEDVAAIINSQVKLVYPYSYSAIHDSPGNLPLDGLDRTPACGQSLRESIHFSLFVTCVRVFCRDLLTSIDAGAQCIATRCFLQYVALNQECMHCVITTAPNVDEVAQKCSQPLSRFPRRYRNMNTPGLLLLSKTPITSASFTDFHPRAREFGGIVHGYLKAQVAGIGQVVCTYATPYPDIGFYPECYTASNTLSINSTETTCYTWLTSVV